MKIAGPTIENGVFHYTNDPWGNPRDSFIVSPSGQLYHYDGGEMGHGQAFIAIENMGKSLDQLDPETREDWDENIGLSTSIDRMFEGWVVGQVEGAEIFFQSYEFTPQQRKVLYDIINSLPVQEVNIEDSDMGEMLTLSKEETLTYLSEQKVASGKEQIIAESIESTDFTSVPPDHDNYKFLIMQDGSGVFWVPPFEKAGGMRWGEVWQRYQDHPIHKDVVEYLEITDHIGIGYGIDGEILVNTDASIMKYADSLLQWFPNHEYIEWDGQEIQLSHLNVDWGVTAKTATYEVGTWIIDTQDDIGVISEIGNEDRQGYIRVEYPDIGTGLWIGEEQIWEEIDVSALPEGYVDENGNMLNHGDENLKKKGVVKGQTTGGPFDRFWWFGNECYFWDAEGFGNRAIPYDAYTEKPAYFHGEIGSDLQSSSEEIDMSFEAYGYFDRQGFRTTPNTYMWYGDPPNDQMLDWIRQVTPEATGIDIMSEGYDGRYADDHIPLKTAMGPVSVGADLAFVVLPDGQVFSSRQKNHNTLVNEAGLDSIRSSELYNTVRGVILFGETYLTPFNYYLGDKGLFELSPEQIAAIDSIIQEYNAPLVDSDFPNYKSSSVKKSEWEDCMDERPAELFYISPDGEYLSYDDAIFHDSAAEEIVQQYGLEDLSGYIYGMIDGCFDWTVLPAIAPYNYYEDSRKVLTHEITPEQKQVLVDKINDIGARNIDIDFKTFNFDGPAEEAIQWLTSGKTASIREEILLEAQAAMGYLGCFWCKKSVEDIPSGTVELGYFTPLKYGGSDDKRNIITSCEECNKEDLLPEEKIRMDS